MSYEYKDPLKQGYARVRLTAKQHDEIFPKRQRKWYYRYECYISDDALLLHRFSSTAAKVVNVVFFPVMIVLEGWNNVKGEFKRMFNEKKYGSFSGDKDWAGSVAYLKVKAIHDRATHPASSTAAKGDQKP